MKPQELWATRGEYVLFPLDTFRHRIYQEERRVKFLNWLNYKREKKMADAREKMAKEAEKRGRGRK